MTEPVVAENATCKGGLQVAAALTTVVAAYDREHGDDWLDQLNDAIAHARCALADASSPATASDATPSK